jgi:6-phosphogluconolactonase
MSDVRVFQDDEKLLAAAAEHILTAAAEAAAERGRFLLVVAGGTTPRGLYERLASQHAEDIDWERVHLFWGDERCVPADHPDSNYGMMAESLLRHVRIRAANVHRIQCQESPGLAAARYDAELAEFFNASAPVQLGAEPAFDLVLLGVGADGHTASLFPGSAALDATGWAVAAHAPASAVVRERVTLTLPALNASRVCLFLAAGTAKRRPVQHILREGPVASAPDSLLPAARVRARGQTLWFLDAEAGGAARP